MNAVDVPYRAPPTAPRRAQSAARLAVALAALASAAALRAGPSATPPAGRAAAAGPGLAGFTNFETEPVRPLALAPDGRHLYALNTADDRLEVFAVGPDGGLTSQAEVVVGLRPVALALRGHEVWIVNHLSDAVSVVDVADPAAPRVVRTHAVGDEPRDIVVAGPNGDRVFVSAAWRGEPTTPGAGRAGVWVFDANAPAAPPVVVRLFGQKPRALAASPDGRRVYAAIFLSGNGTTVVHETTVAARGLPLPTAISVTVAATPPATGLIVRQSGGRWVDDVGGDWTDAVPFRLPDRDVFALDAAAATPRVVESWSAVGTALFHLAVHPTSGEVWVTNSDARNHVRFEPLLRGQAWTHRVTRLNPRVSPVVVDLNAHIDRRASPGTDDERRRSLAQPLDLVFAPDGQTAYVAAFQSAQVGVLDRAGNVVDRIPVGFGPGGLALDAAGARLFVLNHFSASISTVDLAARAVVATTPLAYDPTPEVVRAGRPLFYDAARTSGHGDMACSSCHVFGDVDGLAWDLGDPTGVVESMPFGLTHPDARLKPRNFKFHPMKGAMVTQSFRGLAGAGPMHWRADRFGDGARPTDDRASFLKFRPAFETLNGLAAPIDAAEMGALADFVLTIRYPPNPYQRLDRGLTPEQQAGANLFSGSHKVDSGLTNCAGCHTLPLGTNQRVNFEGNRTSQDLKAPHLRNLYDKVGRFDVPGEQVSGFGFTHDGAVGTLDAFLAGDVFAFPGDDEGARSARRAEVAAYLMAFDTGMAPAVGAVFAATGPYVPGADSRLDTVLVRAAAGDCDLVAHGRRDGRAQGWLGWQGRWYADRAGAPPTTLEALTADAAAQPLTLRCVPPGDGVRSAVDRDIDGWLDGDELAAGASPRDAAAHPPGAAPAVPWPPPAAPTPSAGGSATPTAVPHTATATGGPSPGAATRTPTATGSATPGPATPTPGAATRSTLYLPRLARHDAEVAP